MKLDIYQIDAFTTELFKGNPAAVIPLESWLPDAQMQALALENNLSETVFFTPLSDNPDHDFHIRWFTPAVEVVLCGHATLAASWVLFNRLGFEKDEIAFTTEQAGSLFVRRDGYRIQLDFPVQPGLAAPVPPGLPEALGCSVVDFYRAHKGMAVLENGNAVLSCTPDMNYIAAMDLDGLIITAEGNGCDCFSRYFAPQDGIAEDPVTGSAHCTIMPYWGARLGKSALHARQVSSRGGDLYCRLDGDRVLISGDAKLYLTGKVEI